MFSGSEVIEVTGWHGVAGCLGHISELEAELGTIFYGVYAAIKLQGNLIEESENENALLMVRETFGANDLVHVEPILRTRKLFKIVKKEREGNFTALVPLS